MIENLNEKLDKLTKLPRPNRTEVSNILKEVYKQGIDHSEKKIIRMYQKYCKNHQILA